MQIERNVYLNKLIARKHNGFVKVITGIRRCGKSYLLNTLFYQHLLESGIEDSHIIRFAFDSAQNLMLIGEDLMEIEEGKRKVDPEKFMTYINDKIVDDGMYYLLLDEVQNLGYFEAVLNGYLRKDNVDVYVTGSNSKFLSSDIITEFAGRGDEVHVLPLSFSEFFSVYDGSKEEAFDDYMVYGGLPSVALMQTEEQKVAYLTTQITNVYLRDIVKRYNLQSDEDIGELLDILASGISTLVNPRKLAGTFKSVKGSTISEVTVAKYIGHMAESFLISKAKRYDVKGKHYIDTPFKVYFEDIGLRNARLNFRQIEPSHIMENIIYNELRYRGYNVDVGVVEVREKNSEGREQRKQLEIDFIANQGSRRYYIQSAYEIPSKEKWDQETKSFDRANDSFKKIIVVERTMKPRRDDKGYVTMGVKEFLLNENSLEL
ncbi:ATP-binding protein [Pseudoflavonifractor capillosus]|uniref:ATP-binding protein n=1 Tax=Pseudoflavonifractor capillosus TaxID=106588 RepID=UPI00195E1E05|nr:ATP-binding protein [Pseudoflavonifractor capillosus]MBM6679119.1 ATP-binding protein [Pseudoflavonifractor capillosus]